MGHFGSGVATDAVAGKMYRELFAHGLAVYAVSFFFAVSGFFSMKYFGGAYSWAWHKRLLQSRFRSLLVPYVMWNALGVLLFSGFPCGVIDGLKHFGLLSVLPIVTPLWYVRNLFVFILLMPVFVWLSRQCLRNRWLGWVALLICVGVSLIDFPLKTNVVMAAMYFNFGIVIALCPDEWRRFYGPLCRSAMVVFAACLVWKGMQGEGLRWIMIPSEIVVLLFLVSRFADCPAFKALEGILPLAFPIYVVHYFPCFYYTRSGTHPLWAAVAVPVCTVVCSVIGAMLMKRVAPRIYGLLMGGRG